MCFGQQVRSDKQLSVTKYLDFKDSIRGLNEGRSFSSKMCLE